MTQASSIGFGNDATVMAGYAHRANDRLGTFTLIVENVGDNDLYLRIKEHDGTTAPSGYADIGGAINVVARGQQTVNLSLISKQIGFFGSGNTIANISSAIRNRADLRGAQIDIVPVGKRGWSLDAGFDRGLLENWGPHPDTGDAPLP